MTLGAVEVYLIAAPALDESPFSFSTCNKESQSSPLNNVAE